MGPEHTDIGVMTGHSAAEVRTTQYPCVGSMISKLRGTTRGMPPFVSLRGMNAGCEPGFLGISHRPYSPGGQAHADLQLPSGVTTERFADRRRLLAAFDACRRDAEDAGTIGGLDAFQQQAFELVTSGRIRDALAIGHEPETTLARYDGVEQFLKARRLIEAGVGCVTLSVGEWDTHKDNFKRLKDTLPDFDHGLSALIGDLHERGLANDVVVVACGEFGRTPRVNAEAGRDHWTPVMSAVVAGGGLPMGQVVGATSPWGDRPMEGTCTVQQVLATVYRFLGIDLARPLLNGAGRPIYLLDDSAPIRGLT
jgi:hypothetical protein